MNEEPPKDPSPTYTPTPEVPQDLAPRLALILEVLSGAKTLAQAAREGPERPVTRISAGRAEPTG